MAEMRRLSKSIYHNSPATFLATLCLFDLIELEKQETLYWERFFYLSEQKQASSSEFENGLQLDITQTLGGFHVMAHANSYFQACMPKANRLGLTWVEFKLHLIYAKWLSESRKAPRELLPRSISGA